MSFFTTRSEAQRYARSRPHFHPLVIERAKEWIAVDHPVPLALDIACGTGQSTVALLSLAEHVVGVDLSAKMLQDAIVNPRVQYAQGRAESIPVASETFPLVTTALAFHWFERASFFAEVWRILRSRGSLVIYNNAFRGVMRGNPSFSGWCSRSYLNRFPTPARDNTPLTVEEARSAGFHLAEQDKFENEIVFTPEELVAYLVTQTNVVAALKSGRESVESANRWLLEQVGPYFTSSVGTFTFATTVWYLEKRDKG